MATDKKSRGPFTVVSDPASFLVRVPGGGGHLSKDRETSLDKLLMDKGNEVLNPDKEHIGTWNPELQLLLNSRIRDMIDTIGHVPIREEALVDLSKKAHPTYTPEELFDYAKRDSSSDSVMLRKLLRVDEYIAQKSNMAVKQAAEKSQQIRSNLKRAQPATLPLHSDAVVASQVPQAPMNAPAIISGPNGTMRVLVQDVVVTDQVLVITQETGNPFSFWEPPMDDTIQWMVSYEGISAYCTFSGISYTIERTGSTHFIFLITE